MKLDEVRKEIDVVDEQMKELFRRRMGVSEKVAATKLESGDEIWKPEREEALIERHCSEIEAPYQRAYGSFLKKMMTLSRGRQYTLMQQSGNGFVPLLREPYPVERVCYAGVPFSYGDMAARALYPAIHPTPCPNFEAVFQAVAKDEADLGVVPIENSTAGNVDEVYDLLLQYDLSIRCCNIQSIRHCLAGVPGASLADVKEACSHPQALRQSSVFLKEHGISVHEAVNTAVAAQQVASEGNRSRAAVCSREAAECYGLQVLAENINHRQDNCTKFYGIGKGLVAAEGQNRISAVFACHHKSGTLSTVLGIFADHGANLTEIHSRPDGENPWNYLFYVDFGGSLLAEDTCAMLLQLTKELPFFRILGCYKSEE